MQQGDESGRPLRRFRWAWFALALIGVLETPFAIVDAIQFARSNHGLAPIMLIAFPIRFGMIWFFFWLWWQYRPVANK
jgi:hypothetical protein